MYVFIENITQQFIFFILRCREFLGQAWMKSNKKSQAEHISQMTKRFNDGSRLVSSEIISRNNMQSRVAAIEKWTAVADICRCLHNFNGVLQVCAAFTNAAVFRLKKTWDKVPKTVCSQLSRLYFVSFSIVFPNSFTDQTHNQQITSCRLFGWPFPCHAWSIASLWSTVHSIFGHVFDRFIIYWRRNTGLYTRSFVKFLQNANGMLAVASCIFFRRLCTRSTTFFLSLFFFFNFKCSLHMWYGKFAIFNKLHTKLITYRRWPLICLTNRFYWTTMNCIPVRCKSNRVPHDWVHQILNWCKLPFLHCLYHNIKRMCVCLSVCVYSQFYNMCMRLFNQI